MGLSIVTDRVHADEPCMGLAEGPLQMPQPDGSTPMRWVQRIFVVRGDTIAKHMIDIGRAEDYEEVPPLLVPGYGDDSVAELQELAARHRNDTHFIKWRQELQQSSTLIADILRQEEQKAPALANRSVFGPGASVQRNEAQRQALQRAHKEKVNGHRH